ncbi:hypothetical protein [Nocardia transvalensis]|uniref:hypothetical protein n=1 Tax=Nocardia transvalensis TaxID=37333 RepID=UPI0018963599|nr:hypothetical protein [Nocardia transvalensis]MBF6328503.1 hypothetical protein [Nocardia transvalensis]
MTGCQLLGLTMAVGLPLAVLVGALFWPQRIPKDKTVEAIRRRIEDEDEWDTYGE